MRIYLAGPISGMPNLNRAAFRAAKSDLKALGHDVVNPLDYTTADMPWAACMRIAIPLMLACDGVCLLDGWTKSKGAMMEVDIAKLVELDVREIAGWLS